MSVIIVDSVGVNIWLGDNVSTSQGSGTVVSIIEDATDMNDAVCVNITGTLIMFPPLQITVTSRVSEQASDADGNTNGITDEGGDV